MLYYNRRRKVLQEREMIMCCKNCGSNLNKSVQYCPVCGEKLSEEKLTSAELLKTVFCEESESRPHKRFGFKITGCLFAGAFAS